MKWIAVKWIAVKWIVDSGEELWIYTSTLRVLVYIHHYSPPLRGIVVYYLKLIIELNLIINVTFAAKCCQSIDFIVRVFVEYSVKKIFCTLYLLNTVPQ